MSTNQSQQKRNDGNFSISDNKIRIQNMTGQSSVLFEDISSISWKKFEIPNFNLISAGVAVLFIGFFFLTLNADKGSSFAYLIIFGGVVLIIMGIVNKIVWEDVIIETRGGMLLSYSVDENKAQTEVNKIEDARRARGLTI